MPGMPPKHVAIRSRGWLLALPLLMARSAAMTLPRPALIRRVSPFAWLGIGLALIMPIYLRYFAWALGGCGATTFMPR